MGLFARLSPSNVIPNPDFGTDLCSYLKSQILKSLEREEPGFFSLKCFWILNQPQPYEHRDTQQGAIEDGAEAGWGLGTRSGGMGLDLGGL